MAGVRCCSAGIVGGYRGWSGCIVAGEGSHSACFVAGGGNFGCIVADHDKLDKSADACHSNQHLPAPLNNWDHNALFLRLQGYVKVKLMVMFIV